MLSVIMLSVIMLSVIMLSVIMLSVIMLNVFMLSVVVPENELPLVSVTGMKRSDITSFEVNCIFKFQNLRKI
jgi:hypothetical protein